MFCFVLICCVGFCVQAVLICKLLLFTMFVNRFITCTDDLSGFFVVLLTSELDFSPIRPSSDLLQFFS